MSILLNREVCPCGPLTGPIIKPVGWRELNDHKRFVADWHQFLRDARRWQRAHPIRKLDEWLWEREKNRIRELWYGYTPGERQRFKDIRAETGIRILDMRPFNGIKYQRGILSGLSVKRASLGPGDTLALDSANNTAVNVEISPPSPLEAGFQLTRNCFLQRINFTGTNNINTAGDWVTPRSSIKGDTYEVIWNVLTGDTPDNASFTEDVWTQITTTRRVSEVEQGTVRSGTFEFDIGVTGKSSSDINQDYSWDAGDNV